MCGPQTKLFYPAEMRDKFKQGPCQGEKQWELPYRPRELGDVQGATFANQSKCDEQNGKVVTVVNANQKVKFWPSGFEVPCPPQIIADHLLGHVSKVTCKMPGDAASGLV